MSIFKCAESELTQSEGRFYIFWRVVWVLAIPVSAFFFLSLPLYLGHVWPCPTPEPFLALRVCCPCLVLNFLFTENGFHFWSLGQELIISRKAAQLTLKHLNTMTPAAALANFACLTFSAFFASPQISLQKDNCSLSDAASSKTFSLFPFCSNWPELIRVLVFLTPRFLLNYSQIQLKVFPTTLVYLLHFRSLPVLSDINSNSVIQYSIAGNFLWFLGPSLIAIWRSFLPQLFLAIVDSQDNFYMNICCLCTLCISLIVVCSIEVTAQLNLLHSWTVQTSCQVAQSNL